MHDFALTKQKIVVVVVVVVFCTCAVRHLFLSNVYFPVHSQGHRLTPCYSGVRSLPGRPPYACPEAQQRVIPRLYVTGYSNISLAYADHVRFIGVEFRFVNMRKNPPGHTVHMRKNSPGHTVHMHFHRSQLEAWPRQIVSITAHRRNGLRAWVLNGGVAR